MENKWTLDTPDGAKIYGVKNSTRDNAKSAIFMVHGLASHMHEYAFKQAADFFAEEYDIYRFNLYDGDDGGRMLLKCTMQTHANDLNTVLAEFSDKYEKVFLIGHSYGGPTVMLANPKNITAVSLWDPSFDLSHIQKEFSKDFVSSGGYYTVNWGTSYLISKDMYDEAGNLDEIACADLAKNFSAPVQVIHAGDGFYVNFDKSYHSFGNSQNIREVVAGTVHCFYEGNSCDDLLSKTKKWFSRF